MSLNSPPSGLNPCPQEGQQEPTVRGDARARAQGVPHTLVSSSHRAPHVMEKDRGPARSLAQDCSARDSKPESTQGCLAPNTHVCSPLPQPGRKMSLHFSPVLLPSRPSSLLLPLFLSLPFSSFLSGSFPLSSSPSLSHCVRPLCLHVPRPPFPSVSISVLLFPYLGNSPFPEPCLSFLCCLSLSPTACLCLHLPWVCPSLAFRASQSWLSPCPQVPWWLHALCWCPRSFDAGHSVRRPSAGSCTQVSASYSPPCKAS